MPSGWTAESGDILSVANWQPTSLTFVGADSSTPVVVIHPDGRVEWNGDQSEAAVEFWKAVEAAFPGFLAQRKQA